MPHLPTNDDHCETARGSTARRVYKILTADDWAAALSSGAYHGSADDRRDGFIHLSTFEQVRGTAERHFKGRSDLVLVAFDATALGPLLRWEPSRGGVHFPHLYGPLPATLALEVQSMTLDANGVPQMATGYD